MRLVEVAALRGNRRPVGRISFPHQLPRLVEPANAIIQLRCQADFGGEHLDEAPLAEADGYYLYLWWIIPGPNRLSVLNSGERAQIGPYQPCPLQSFSAVDSHFSALESHTAHLCERMNN
jgi:hypothetical protein